MTKEIKLGISIYPEIQKMGPMKRYAKEAWDLGYKRIFTSMSQINKENKYSLISKFKRILSYCSELGFEITLDVAPYVFKELNIKLPNIDFFKKLKVNTIRLDEKIGNGIEAEILRNNKDIELELNVSTSLEDLDEIINDWGSNERIKTSHNFYPQRYTGLSFEHFKKHSIYCKEKDLRVQAFITSQDDDAKFGPWGINEGLCTLEENRDSNIAFQVAQLSKIDFIDDLSFGNANASYNELKWVSDYIKNNKFDSYNKDKYNDFINEKYNKDIDEEIINLEIKLDKNISQVEKEIVLKYDNHFRRPDINDYTIRSTMPRIDFSSSKIIPRESNRNQRYGEVYILNDSFDRYKGELQIILKEMPYDSRKNFIGKISEDDMESLNNIESSIKFKFNSI